MQLSILLPLLLIIPFGAYVYYLYKKRSSVIEYIEHEFQILEIKVPKGDDSKPQNEQVSALAAEQMFASLHGLLRADSQLQEHFSFEIVSDSGALHFFVTAPTNVIKFVEGQIYAQYPTAQIAVVEDYVRDEVLANTNFEIGILKQSKDHFFPIKVFRDFEVDPLSTILSSLVQVKEDEGVWIQFLIRPMSDGWQASGYNYISLVSEGQSVKSEPFVKGFFSAIFKEFVNILVDIPSALFRNQEDYYRPPLKPLNVPVKLSPFQELELGAIENKLSKMGYEVIVRIVSHSQNQDRVDSNLRSVIASFKQFTTTGVNDLVLSGVEDSASAIDRFKNRGFLPEQSIILNNEELATLFHLPYSRAKSPNVSWVYSKKGEPPSYLPTEDCNYIGETMHRGKKVRFGLKNGDDRLRHMYLIGKTGTGKSTLLENMALQDIINGEGIGILDPHGETIDKVLDRIPDHRADDVIVIDPSDFDRPVGLNLLELEDPEEKNLMASALVAAIKQHFDYSWGPRLEYLLNYALLTLLDVPGTSMLGITRLLEDNNYQNYILENVKDPVVRRFWEKEWKEAKGNQRFVTEAVAPIQNKVNRFLASTTIRNILGQRNSTVDLWDIMQNRKILLINLSKGKIGADNANLLGALLVSRIQFMALQRAKIPYEERTPFYLYVDEFQNFATGTFEEILSESRKYKLGLYLTHQYTSQLSEELMSAVFGNVGTIASFSLGAPDARVLANEFQPYFDDEDIISLEKFQIYLKLMVDGMTSLPFSAKILLPWLKETEIAPVTGNKERILQMSREKYGSDRQYVEGIIGRWVERRFDKGMAIAEKRRAENESTK